MPENLVPENFVEETNLAPSAVAEPADKFAIEAELRREPGNSELRAQYRGLLERINRSTVGLSTIVLP